ncbi:hypothetical protein EYF80_009813 [Liparis tanakae]|uniref:Uncharacterized protein n=1 Tax=Liparis tanakae TaxID=230148 RepID=A0A4Z2IQ18_9TELE|nr:hypothetical protein EYF80_009813 [Liparis tanakae]
MAGNREGWQAMSLAAVPSSSSSVRQVEAEGGVESIIFRYCSLARLRITFRPAPRRQVGDNMLLTETQVGDNMLLTETQQPRDCCHGSRSIDLTVRVQHPDPAASEPNFIRALDQEEVVGTLTFHLHVRHCRVPAEKERLQPEVIHFFTFHLPYYD